MPSGRIDTVNGVNEIVCIRSKPVRMAGSVQPTLSLGLC